MVVVVVVVACWWPYACVVVAHFVCSRPWLCSCETDVPTYYRGWFCLREALLAKVVRWNRPRGMVRHCHDGAAWRKARAFCKIKDRILNFLGKLVEVLWYKYKFSRSYFSQVFVMFAATCTMAVPANDLGQQHAARRQAQDKTSHGNT